MNLRLAVGERHALLAILSDSGKLSEMVAAHSNDVSPIPSAPFDDLDLDRDDDEEEWSGA